MKLPDRLFGLRKMADKLQRRRLVERILALRAARKNFLPPEILGEPAWDILLELYVSALQERKMSPADFATDVPPSTVRRWLETLNNAGLVTSTRSAIGSAAHCSLTEKGRLALDRLIESLTADLTLR